MSALTSYRSLLQLVGPVYIAVAFLGRIPLAMSQLGVMVLVTDATGSYGTAGAAAGMIAIANAIGSPFAGALADRIGQRPVVLAQSLTGAAALGLLVAVTDSGGSKLAIFTVAALAGVAIPQVGPLARVRWRPLAAAGAPRPESEAERLVDAAFSYEGSADEASFVLGPALIGTLAIAVSPAGALLAGAAMLAIFGTWFALHPTADAVRPHVSDDSRSTGRLWTAAFVVLVGAQLLVGAIFGSVQTGTTVLTDAAGNAGAAGLIHAVLGVGSVVAGLAMAGLPTRIRYATRQLVSAIGLLVLSLPLLGVDSIGSLIAVIAALGFAVAPFMINNFALAGALVPVRRVSAAMTMLAGATGLGYALGAAIAGRLADAGGHTPAFVVTITAAGLAVLLSLAANPVLRRARPASS